MNKFIKDQIAGQRVGLKHVPWLVSIGMLLAGVLVAAGPQVAELADWSEARTPGFVGETMRIVGGVVIGWAGQLVRKQGS